MISVKILKSRSCVQTEMVRIIVYVLIICAEYFLSLYNINLLNRFFLALKKILAETLENIWPTKKSLFITFHLNVCLHLPYNNLNMSLSNKCVDN